MEERRQEWCIGHCAYRWRTKGEVRDSQRREVGEWLGLEVKLIGSRGVGWDVWFMNG
jgi:hypothetical protein